MNAVELYRQLDNDFIKTNIRDDWYARMTELEPYISENYKERSMGLVCDFTELINKVYTAVFPSEHVMNRILADGAKNAMLFVHHPMTWDFNNVVRGVTNSGFYNMSTSLLDSFKENNVSIYNLHHPLDHYGPYSTSKTLAEALEIEIIDTFAEYCGAVCGVIGVTKCNNVNELDARFSNCIGHGTKLYPYGDSAIKNKLVAVCAGGGNQMFAVKHLVERDIPVNVLVTGIASITNRSVETHEFEKDNKINVLSGTHYSTEKFACIAMCGYFKKLGLDAEFISDTPCFIDM